MDEKNKYRHTAQFYDLDDRPITRDDIPFYLKYIYGKGCEVLELCCGTGRVALPLMRAGAKVYGIDSSPTMLEILKEKLELLPQHLEGSMEWSEGDVSKYKLDRLFDLVIMPFRSFQMITDTADVQLVLRNVVEHMKPDGQFIINLFKPYDDLSNWEGEEETLWTKTNVAMSETVRRTNTNVYHDIQRQLMQVKQCFYVQRTGSQTKKFEDNLLIRYYSYAQIKVLLEKYFDVVEEYGYYDRTQLGLGSEMIFVCHHKGSDSGVLYKSEVEEITK